MEYKKHKHAFTIVELLLALALTALLLTAVAVAFNASIKDYQINEEIFKTMNGARQALLRITTHLRTANAVDPASAANECTLITAAGQNITYRYNSADKKLYLITNDDLSDSDYVLCDNIASMNFKKDTGVDGSTTYVKSIQIVMTVGSGNTSQTVPSAAAIRKNLER